MSEVAIASLVVGLLLGLLSVVCKAFALRVVLLIVRAWVQLYTAMLPTEVKAGRRDEIESDVWEHQRQAFNSGYSPEAIAAQIFLRWFCGVAEDLTWRISLCNSYLNNAKHVLLLGITNRVLREAALTGFAYVFYFVVLRRYLEGPLQGAFVFLRDYYAFVLTPFLGWYSFYLHRNLDCLFMRNATLLSGVLMLALGILDLLFPLPVSLTVTISITLFTLTILWTVLMLFWRGRMLALSTRNRAHTE